MATYMVFAAGALIGATRGVFTLLISAILVAIFTFAVNASEGVGAGAHSMHWMGVRPGRRVYPRPSDLSLVAQTFCQTLRPNMR